MNLRTILLDTVDSTNTYLRALPPEEEGGSTLVVARYQQAGRGAGSNRWESEAGKNLLLSLRIHPSEVSAHEMFVLSEALALAVFGTLNSYAQGFSIKWPNDIYYDDKKIAGLLIENDLMGERVQTSVLGIGMNVNQTLFISDAPNPISLAQITGGEIPLEEVLENLIAQLSLYNKEVEKHHYDAIHSSYLSNLYRWNEEHSFRDAEGLFKARIVDVERSGQLVLLDSAGRQRRYSFKEVEYII